MAKYMIHTYPKRLWYVEEYLIPSMIEQGIYKEDIHIYNDDIGEGNLRACMRAFSIVDKDERATWHLQDDVCICKDFKYYTELFDDCGIVCGFSSEMYDGKGRIGAVHSDDMWFSFPCIHIPNHFARGCSEWVTKYLIGNMAYKEYWEKGVNDDWAFRRYIHDYRHEELALNVAPNLVDHVDYLLGGGSDADKKREKWVRAQYWRDYDIIEELEEKLLNRGK